jgi:hypothetical protein
MIITFSHLPIDDHHYGWIFKKFLEKTQTPRQLRIIPNFGFFKFWLTILVTFRAANFLKMHWPFQGTLSRTWQTQNLLKVLQNCSTRCGFQQLKNTQLFHTCNIASDCPNKEKKLTSLYKLHSSISIRSNFWVGMEICGVKFWVRIPPFVFGSQDTNGEWSSLSA